MVALLGFILVFLFYSLMIIYKMLKKKNKNVAVDLVLIFVGGLLILVIFMYLNVFLIYFFGLYTLGIILKYYANQS
ncbi:RsiW-degrading membrane proteinase PrsW (M82 family) [Evansella vedderi]|uniref:RsiW-degrading membrane proteinase PrsW (M82 family) n=1 Tax=Evansella vedderi TaxID=38282 RepID=A0ABT9ZRM7_9BACI|nr:hypothetical protein [Evansella vedderi]MDQ0253524.1 RsiW-degrading membrane proteinase PrsW (M82 family) [Evansella vedderi]